MNHEKMTTRKDVKKSRRCVGGCLGPWKRAVRRSARRHVRQAVACGDFDFTPLHLTAHDVS